MVAWISVNIDSGNDLVPLDQCWLIAINGQWHSSKGDFTRDTSALNHEISLNINYLKLHPHLLGISGLPNSWTWNIAADIVAFVQEIVSQEESLEFCNKNNIYIAGRYTFNGLD